MSGILRHKTIVIGCIVLTTSWLVMSANAENKQGQNRQKKLTTVSQVESLAVKPTVKRSVKEPKPIFYPELTKRELKIQAALNADSGCDFSKTPLSEVIKSLADRHGITMLLLEDKLKEEGISIDEPVSLSVKGIALKNVLKLILKPIDLTYMVDRERLKITSRLHEEEIYQTRVYPVGDFGNTIEVYLELGSTISKHVSLGYYRVAFAYTPFYTPFQGGGGGSGFFQVISEPNPPELSLRPYVYDEKNGGTIVAVRLSESLVISQTYHAHNEIVELLTQLRRARALD
ncbi:hypothetical protein [Gimesia alba]|nr:hypothetical protein [Gimesia alba]